MGRHVPHVVIRVKLIFIHGWTPSLDVETFVVLGSMERNHNNTWCRLTLMDENNNVKKARQLISSNQQIAQTMRHWFPLPRPLSNRPSPCLNFTRIPILSALEVEPGKRQEWEMCKRRKKEFSFLVWWVFEASQKSKGSGGKAPTSLSFRVKLLMIHTTAQGKGIRDHSFLFNSGYYQRSGQKQLAQSHTWI